MFDVLKGFGILGFLAFHLAYDLSSLPDFFINYDYLIHTTPNLQWVDGMVDYIRSVLFQDFMYALVNIFASMFLFVSGICTIYSHNNLKRALFTSICAFVVSLVTFAIEKIMDSSGIFIRFGILHSIAIGMIIVALMDLFGKKMDSDIYGPILFYIGLIIVIAGAMINQFDAFSYSDNPIIKYLFVSIGIQVDFSDWFPIFPYSGVLIIGAGLARMYKDWFLSLPKEEGKVAKYFSPLTFLGRHSIWFYLFHQLVYLPLIFIIFAILGFRLF